MNCLSWCQAHEKSWLEKCFDASWLSGAWCVACSECSAAIATHDNVGNISARPQALFKPVTWLFKWPHPCHTAPWPSAAIEQGAHLRQDGERHSPRTLWLWVGPSTICLVGQGRADRAETVARFLIRGMLRVHARGTTLPSFSRALSIDLSDDVAERWAPTAAGPPTDTSAVDVALACESHACTGVLLLPVATTDADAPATPARDAAATTAAEILLAFGSRASTHDLSAHVNAAARTAVPMAPHLASVLYLNRRTATYRRKQLLAALRARRVGAAAERTPAFASWREAPPAKYRSRVELVPVEQLSVASDGVLHPLAARALARIPRCTLALRAPVGAVSSGRECTAARPHCCFAPGWSEEDACAAHSAAAAQALSTATSATCSSLTGHTLSLFVALERLAAHHRAGSINGLVAIIEDDVRPDIFWAKRLAEFVREQPVHTWDLAKLHGGGPPPQQSWRHAMAHAAANGQKHDWWSALPAELWGTHALLVHSSRAAGVLATLRAQPLASADMLITTAWARGELTLGASRHAIFVRRRAHATARAATAVDMPRPVRTAIAAFAAIDAAQWRFVGDGCCRSVGSDHEQPPPLRISGSTASTFAQCAASCAADAQCTAFEALTAGNAGCRTYKADVDAIEATSCGESSVGGDVVTVPLADALTAKNTSLLADWKVDGEEAAGGVGNEDAGGDEAGGASRVCMARRRPERRMASAVCVLGAWRSFERTASTIRKYVLEPLDADAYGVIELPAEPVSRSVVPELDDGDANEEAPSPRRCETLLGPRVSGRCHVANAAKVTAASRRTIPPCSSSHRPVHRHCGSLCCVGPAQRPRQMAWQCYGRVCSRARRWDTTLRHARSSHATRLANACCVHWAQHATNAQSGCSSSRAFATCAPPRCLTA